MKSLMWLPAVVTIASMVLAAPAYAIDFKENPEGFIDFTTPSNNIGCVYHIEQGSGAVLECDRVAPSYVRVRMFAKGVPLLYTHVGDASCCGAENYLAYAASWMKGSFYCISTREEFRCNNGLHGFSMNRHGVKTY